MIELANYSQLYPYLPIEILFFFNAESNNGKLVQKEISMFCNHYKIKYKTPDIPQPRIVSKICDILCEHNQLSILKQSGPDNLDSSYICFIKDRNLIENSLVQNIFNTKLSYIIYGFKYIYADYRKFVLPIEYTTNSGNRTLGTCFIYNHGLATAKHCIEGAKKISIQGIFKNDLQNAKFEIHENELMDLLFIRFQKEIPDSILFSENAELLDEIMTLGYPKIAGYHNFLTAEKANISARFTATVGQIASNARDIWIRENLLLITAKIKGGNSGGPVISRNGSVIGVSVNCAEGEGDYDDLGYGTVLPVSFLDEIINNNVKKYLDISSIEFIDFK